MLTLLTLKMEMENIPRWVFHDGRSCPHRCPHTCSLDVGWSSRQVAVSERTIWTNQLTTLSLVPVMEWINKQCTIVWSAALTEAPADSRENTTAENVRGPARKTGQAYRHTYCPPICLFVSALLDKACRQVAIYIHISEAPVHQICVYPCRSQTEIATTSSPCTVTADKESASLMTLSVKVGQNEMRQANADDHYVYKIASAKYILGEAALSLPWSPTQPPCHVRQQFTTPTLAGTGQWEPTKPGQKHWSVQPVLHLQYWVHLAGRGL